MHVPDICSDWDSRLACGSRFHWFEVDGIGPDLDAPVGDGPLLTGKVSVDFDTVSLRVSEVQRLTDTVVGRTTELPAVPYARQRVT